MKKDKTMHNLRMAIFWLEAPFWKRMFIVHTPIYIVSLILWILFFYIDFLNIYSSINKTYGVKGITMSSWLFHKNPDLYRAYELELALWTFLIPAVYPVWLETKNFFRRRKLGVKLEEETIKLKNMMENYENSSFGEIRVNTDKTDIGYWHELLQKGAITEEEYNKKKEELL